jgi:hypothetical protein
MRGSFYSRLHRILNHDESPDPAISKYFRAVRERKDLVFGARNRKWAYLDIISQRTTHRPTDAPEDKIIVFHERIENLEEIVAPTDYRRFLDNEGEDGEHSVPGMRELDADTDVALKYRADPVEKEVDKNLETLFFKAAFEPVMYHSGHASPHWNEIGMEWFRADIAKVMLSVKALVEGVDVPAANVGIVRASSSSVRQRIQTTGRILRRAAGKERPAELYVIYVKNTTDERIFKGIDWSEQLGATAVESWHWYAPEEATELHGDWVDQAGSLPEVPEFQREEEVVEFDAEDLDTGDYYPGRYAGREYHVDSKGRPFKKTRAGRVFIANDEVKQAGKAVFELKRGGKFLITPDNHIITRIKEVGLVFLGVLSGEIEFEETDRGGSTLGDAPPTFDELFS